MPAQVRAREAVIRTVTEVFKAFGYAPLETPAIENLDTLTGKYGDEADRLIFKILKRGEAAGAGEADLGLRFDLTVPLARVVATYRDLPLPFKRYQIQPVWRAERPQKGRFREFWQCDVDCVGSAAMLADAEVIAITYEALAALDLGEFVIHVNHRKILNALVAAAGVPGELALASMRALDKWDKIGDRGVLDELARAGVSPAAADKIVGVLKPVTARAKTPFTSYVGAAQEIFGADREGLQGLAEMEELSKLSDAFGVPETALSFDLHLARGLDYYTGPIFEAVVAGAGVGSVAGGGRYDTLIGQLGGPDLPATGVSLGLERILTILEEKRTAEDRPIGYAPLMVAVFDAEHARAAAKLARDVRAAGIPCEIYADPAAKLAKQFSHADAKGIRIVALVGPDELANGTVAVKDLRSRTQQQIPRDELATFLRSLLREK